MMDMLLRIGEGLAFGLQPAALLVITIGILIGMVVGAAPGIGSTVGMSVALPFALTLSPEHAVLILVSIFIAATYSNSVPAVLIRMPGTASAMLTAVEGHPFHQRGEGGKALLISLISSVLGQMFGIITFILFVIPLSHIAVQLLFPEMFAIVVLGLITAASLVSENVVKGLVAIAIGLTLSAIGTDPITGTPRLTFGVPNLTAGLGLVPVIVGLLAFREVFATAERFVGRWPSESRKLEVNWLTRSEAKEMAAPTALGSVIGTMIGAVPGAGGSIASFLSYQIVRTFSRDKGQFGNGSVRGLAAIESSNNSATAGELIPTFGLGIPGAPPMVVVMAALSAQGLIAGPQLMQTRPGLLYATFGGLLVGCIVLAVVGYLLIKPSVALSRLSPAATLVMTNVLIVVGIFALRWSMTDVWVCLIIGFCGYILDRYGYSVAPMALAFILGEILESSLRRGLIMTDGFTGFITQPVTFGLLLFSVFVLALPVIAAWRQRRRMRKSPAG